MKASDLSRREIEFPQTLTALGVVGARAECADIERRRLVDLSCEVLNRGGRSRGARGGTAAVELQQATGVAFVDRVPLLRGRDYVLPEDVTDIAPDVLRHRLVLPYEALAGSLSADELVRRVMQRIPAPDKPLETHFRVGAQS